MRLLQHPRMRLWADAKQHAAAAADGAALVAGWSVVDGPGPCPDSVDALPQAEARIVRTAAWYAKVRPTFSDALAVVRRELWSSCHFAMSESHTEMVKIPRSVFERLSDTVCYAA